MAKRTCFLAIGDLPSFKSRVIVEGDREDLLKYAQSVQDANSKTFRLQRYEKREAECWKTARYGRKKVFRGKTCYVNGAFALLDIVQRFKPSFIEPTWCSFIEHKGEFGFYQKFRKVCESNQLPYYLFCNHLCSKFEDGYYAVFQHSYGSGRIYRLKNPEDILKIAFREKIDRWEFAYKPYLVRNFSRLENIPLANVLKEKGYNVALLNVHDSIERIFESATGCA